ncbi:MAG: endolytic transglycosylase MltG [Deltaproteobacteria bacterium]|nr:endolytic transglycosylase MltG [Deltaproteobacteria bacterium]
MAILVALIILEVIIFLVIFVLPVNPFSKEDVTVLIPKGSSAKEVASILKSSGAIRSALGFRILVKLKKFDTALKSGEYVIKKNMTPNHILKKLVQGDYIKREVRVIPCTTLKDLSQEIVKAGLGTANEVETALFDSKLFAKYSIPYPSLEGYSLPDTYYFTRPISVLEIIDFLVGHLFQRLESAGIQEKAKRVNFTIHEVLTLASIIEAEAKDPFERPLISSVYHNRLKRGMPLQADPTVAYGLKKLGQPLSYQDLATPNPYNTYLITGLPPSPICFPSFESIQSAVEPLETNYLYFVADGTGRHKFSVSFDEHLKSVQLFRKSNQNHK